ncbi:MAG TPA: RIP metalloprotease RseP [Flavobacteriaceae bacterium]|nr:RIP metalloprotease RseP [Flavobacteriaceae bacterium]
MDPFFIKAIQLLLSLSLLIVLHEFGHFIPAKIFKTRVEKFYLFFDVKFSLFKKKIGETVYGIGWLPLGGYVKISGMIDESMDKEQMAQPPQPWEFRSKPTWQRLIIMLGGVTVNIIVGVLLFIMIVFVWGSSKVESMPKGFAVTELFEEFGFEDGDQILKVNGEQFENPLDINRQLFVRDVQNISVLHQNGEKETISVPEEIGSQMWQKGIMQPFSPRRYAGVDSVVAGSPAAKAGLQKGDSIVGINGSKIVYWNEFAEQVDQNKNKTITLEYVRDNETKQAQIVPNSEGNIGVYIFGGALYELEKVHYGFSESIVKGFELGYWTLHDYVAQFSYVFTAKGATQLGGFGAIGSLFPDQWDWQRFWATTAFISIILAFMNILPIPALDGGHVMFLLYEMISGRKPNEKFMEYAQMVGFFILIALVLYANGNDVYRWLFE